jgi:hypothetical protein
LFSTDAGHQIHEDTNHFFWTVFLHEVPGALHGGVRLVYGARDA